MSVKQMKFWNEEQEALRNAPLNIRGEIQKTQSTGTMLNESWSAFAGVYENLQGLGISKDFKNSTMIQLRDYQIAAIAETNKALETKASALIVMATGTGKTVVFTHLAAARKKRVLILAHRQELIEQAADKVFIVTGERPAIEMAQTYSSEHSAYGTSKIVVASVQTMISGKGDKKRMERFRPGDFDLVIVDEAHHATANSYKQIIEYFTQYNPQCKVLGVTATPDRSDKTRLGDTFAGVSFIYDLNTAIKCGYLVPINQRIVDIESLSFDDCKTRGGDYVDSDIARVMTYEKTLHGVVTPSVEICKDKKTVVFAASVEHSERIAEIWNRHCPGAAKSISGKMPKEERKQLLKAFARGDFQVLTSCMVLIEGWDCPGLEAIVVARPTKSRALYAQMLGRGTRTLPGVVDEPDYTAEERKKAIAQSEKSEILILDFAGNSTKHKLVCSIDLLAGNASEKAIARAKKYARKGGRTEQLVEEAEEAENQKETIRNERLRRTQESRRSLIVAKAEWRTSAIDPFALGVDRPQRDRPFAGDRPVSEKMRAVLVNNGMNPDELSFAAAGKVIHEINSRRERGLCTFKQASWLRKYGLDSNVSRDEASRVLSLRWGKQ